MRLFSYDSPIIRALSQIFDLIVLNLLFIVCSLPIVTAGASLTAMIRVVQSMVYQTDTGVIRPFFRAFRENFKAVTPIWLLFVLVAVSLVCDAMLVNMLGGAQWWYTIIIVVGLVVLSVKIYLFPMMARYENALGKQVKNALILALAHLPSTICMLIMELLPVLLFMLKASYAHYLLILWPLLGFSSMAYLQSATYLRKIFAKVEPAEDEAKEEEMTDPSCT